MSNITREDLFNAFCRYREDLVVANSEARPEHEFLNPITRIDFDRVWQNLSPVERTLWSEKFNQGYGLVASAQRDRLLHACSIGGHNSASRNAA